jgi:hypothetical protein
MPSSAGKKTSNTKLRLATEKVIGGDNRPSQQLVTNDKSEDSESNDETGSDSGTDLDSHGASDSTSEEDFMGSLNLKKSSAKLTSVSCISFGSRHI